MHRSLFEPCFFVLGLKLACAAPTHNACYGFKSCLVGIPHRPDTSLTTVEKMFDLGCYISLLHYRGYANNGITTNESRGSTSMHVTGIAPWEMPAISWYSYYMRSSLGCGGTRDKVILRPTACESFSVYLRIQPRGLFK